LKPTCSLNHVRSEDYDLETRSKICSACIDNDILAGTYTLCPEGEATIQTSKDQQVQAEMKRQELIRILERQIQEHKEAPNQEFEEKVSHEFAALQSSLISLKAEATLTNAKIESHAKRLKRLGY
jgi:hypothetical protein